MSRMKTEKTAQRTANLGIAKRRTALDEFIYEYVDIHVARGVMWPKPVPTHPRSMATTLNITDILKDVKLVLDRYDVKAGVCSNVAFRQYPRGSPPVVKYGTILEVPCRGDEKSRLDALESIQFRLDVDKLHLRVDLVNDAPQPYFHTILPDNPIVARWENHYRKEVMTIIRKRQWQSINVFHCGQSPDRDQCPITLVVKAWDSCGNGWMDTIIPALATVWPYDIRLRSAKELETVSKDARGTNPKTLDALPIEMGSRIDLGGSCGGTLGGAIDLQCPDGTISRLGITTTQVARHKSTFWTVLRPSPSEPNKGNAGQKNFHPSPPSDSDTCSSVTPSHNSGQSSNVGRTEDEGPQNLPAWAGSSKAATAKGKRDAVLRWLEDLDTLHEREIMHMRQLNQELVALMPTPRARHRTYTSGPYKWLVTWSLLKPSTPDQQIENTIPNTSSPHSSKIHHLQGKKVTNYSPYSTCPAGRLVSKRGGTTGWTDGNVNSIPAELNFRRNYHLHSKGISHYSYKRASVWVCQGVATAKDSKFCKAGDAGGFVLDSHTGSAVGVLLGNDRDSGDGYFVPFGDVMKDIELVTGGKVINPTVENDG